MIQQAYIGFPDEQNGVINELSAALSTTPSGIFIVGGAGRTGKNSTVTKALEAAHIPISSSTVPSEVKPFINVRKDDPELYIQYLQDSVTKGERIIALGEVPVQYEKTLKAIADLCRQYPDMKFIFNVIQREVPAWENEKLQQTISTRLSELFKEQLHYFHLRSDRVRIVDELWKQSQENTTIHLKLLAEQLGLEDLYYSKLQYIDNEVEFRSTVNDAMKEETHGHPEQK